LATSREVGLDALELAELPERPHHNPRREDGEEHDQDQ
jgi:hypothetical protein